MTADVKPEIARFHLDVLAYHNANMFDTLIQPYHVISPNLKEVEFDDRIDRGYFARKDKTKYWLQDDMIDLLPIRVDKPTLIELKYKEDIVFLPGTGLRTFRILPEKTMEIREMIDGFVPFQHTHPDQWFIMKVIAFAAYIGKTFICVTSEPAFGKTSVFTVLHSITDKCPVFKPRSVPGTLSKITGSGNLVFDEAHESSKDTRDIMEEMTLTLGGGSTTYNNGALKASMTKSKYECPLQSITFLYNNLECYKEPEKRYFEVIFKNNDAMDDRLLKFKLDGRLEQKFTRDFNIKKSAKENRDYYIKINKMLLWLQEYKQSGKYEKKFSDGASILKLKGRRKIVMDEILWLLDQCCIDQEEYDKYLRLLETAIVKYKEMVSVFNDTQGKLETEVEDVE